jgi:hypothetical protein
MILAASMAALTVAVIVFGVIFGLTLFNTRNLATRAIHTSDHRWCTTLALLTTERIGKPANPQANPSRENAYLFYTHLKTLEAQFGC